MDNSKKDKAYEADMKMRADSENKLKDTQEYLEVILKEIEQKNEELKRIKDETQQMQSALNIAVKDAEFQKKNESAARKSGVLFIALSIVEGIAIIALIIVLILSKNSNEIDTASSEAPVATVIPSDESSEQVTEKIDEVTPKASKVYCDNLSELIAKTKDDKAKYTAEVVTRNGFEYLCLHYSSADVLYRNEYIDDDDIFRKSVIVENGNKRVEFVAVYDIGESITSFAPYESELNNETYFVFVEGASVYTSGIIPERIICVNKDTLEIAEQEDIEGMVRDQISFEVLPNDMSSDSGMTRIKAGIKSNLMEYEIATDKYDELVYFETELPEVKRDFCINYIGNELVFSTDITLGDDIQLGELTFAIKLKDGEIRPTKINYESYSFINQ